MQPPWKTVWRLLRKLNIELPYDPETPLLGIDLDKTTIQRHTCSPILTAALFTIAKTWKQPKCSSTDDWIKKIRYIYTMEYYTAIKKRNNSICSHMDATSKLLHVPWISHEVLLYSTGTCVQALGLEHNGG